MKVLILAICFVLFSCEPKHDNKSSVPDQKSQLMVSLPDFLETDQNGFVVKSSDLKGRFTYVQFSKTFDYRKDDSFSYVISKYGNRNDFRILNFAREKRGEENSSSFRNNVSFFLKDFDRIKEKFSVPACCDSFLLFDKEGKLLFKSYLNDKEQLKVVLKKFLDASEFRLKNYLRVGDQINDVFWLNQLPGSTEKNKTFRLICLMTSVCSSCPSGTIIERIKSLPIGIQNRVAVDLIFLDFSSVDIRSFKKHFNINANVSSAVGPLFDYWTRMKNEYSEALLTNILILIDHQGRIVNIAEPSCNCGGEFFTDLKKRLGEVNETS